MVLTLEQIKSILRKSLDLKKEFRVFVFGSRAKGNFRPYSDLDLWIDAEPDLSTAEIGNILSEFEDSDVSINVDIVTSKTCLDAYLPKIESEKLLWFENKDI